MVFDFDSEEFVSIPNFKGGEGHFDAKMHDDGKCKIIYGKVEPGCTSGYHAHEALDAVAEDAWTAESIDAALEPLPEALDLKKRVVFQAVRVAECGNMVSPPLGETMALIGRADCMARLDRARTMAL